MNSWGSKKNEVNWRWRRPGARSKNKNPIGPTRKASRQDPGSSCYAIFLTSGGRKKLARCETAGKKRSPRRQAVSRYLCQYKLRAQLRSKQTETSVPLGRLPRKVERSCQTAETSEGSCETAATSAANGGVSDFRDISDYRGRACRSVLPRPAQVNSAAPPLAFVKQLFRWHLE